MYSNTIKCDCGSPVDLDQTDWCDVCDKSIFAEPKNKAMTAKNKAIELVDKFNQYTVRASTHYPNGKIVECKNDAKQCALIAVNMIIEYLQHKWETIGFAEYIMDMNEYIEVKQEIEKL
jgi:hypothetical protein